MIILDKIIHVLIYHIIYPTSVKDEIIALTTLVGIIAIVNLFITFPIIFNFFIIPSIEKRYKRKLKYSLDIYKLYPEFLYKNLDIASYVVLNFLKIKKIKRSYALVEINYSIKDAAKTEVIMSFFALTNLTLGVIAMIIFGIVYNF